MSTRDSRLGATTIASLSVALLLVGYVAHAALPTNPINLPGEQPAFITAWCPEGWEFFTRDPEDARVTRFTRSALGHWEVSPFQRNGTAANLFGASRTGMAQGHEMSQLMSLVDEARATNPNWTDCRGTDLECLDSTAQPLTIHNPTSSPTLCGDVGFVRRKPTPWAWARSNDKILLPAQVLRVTVQC
jgi:antimicrobial peptide system SdpA family protein